MVRALGLVSLLPLFIACASTFAQEECLRVEGDDVCPSADEAALVLVADSECVEIVSVDGEASRNNADTADMGWTPPQYNCCYPCTERETCRL